MPIYLMCRDPGRYPDPTHLTDTDFTGCARLKSKPDISLLHPARMDRHGDLANSLVLVDSEQERRSNW